MAIVREGVEFLGQAQPHIARRILHRNALMVTVCTLAALYHTVPGYDLVLGMNRDEDRLRPAEPPQTLPGPPPLVAPRDSKAGGTWIGVNHEGLVAALANRRGRTSTSAKSRGLLLLEVLKVANVRAAGIAVEHEVARY